MCVCGSGSRRPASTRSGSADRPASKPAGCRPIRTGAARDGHPPSATACRQARRCPPRSRPAGKRRAAPAPAARTRIALTGRGPAPVACVRPAFALGRERKKASAAGAAGAGGGWDHSEGRARARRARPLGLPTGRRRARGGRNGGRPARLRRVQSAGGRLPPVRVSGQRAGVLEAVSCILPALSSSGSESFRLLNPSGSESRICRCPRAQPPSGCHPVGRSLRRVRIKSSDRRPVRWVGAVCCWTAAVGPSFAHARRGRILPSRVTRECGDDGWRAAG